MYDVRMWKVCTCCVKEVKLFWETIALLQCNDRKCFSLAGKTKKALDGIMRKWRILGKNAKNEQIFEQLIDFWLAESTKSGHFFPTTKIVPKTWILNLSGPLPFSGLSLNSIFEAPKENRFFSPGLWPAFWSCLGSLKSFIFSPLSFLALASFDPRKQISIYGIPDSDWARSFPAAGIDEVKLWEIHIRP